VLVDEVANQRIVQIEWHPADALPFPLCLSEVIPADGIRQPAAVALGNIVLVDHGRTIASEEAGSVPFPVRLQDRR
jgi:hypothetical protein